MKDIKNIIITLNENRSIFEKYGVDLIGVFGSYVRGDATNRSDLDILINPNGTKPFGIFALIHLEDELNNLLGIKVDLAIKRSLKPFIGKQILQEVVEV